MTIDGLPVRTEFFDIAETTGRIPFYKQMVNTRRIPLTFAPEEPNAESRAAIAEGDSFLASGKPGRFSNGHDLLQDAMS